MILFKALTGSRLHGLHNDSSDHDWKTVVVSPIRHVLSPFRTIKGKESISQKEDQVTYEFVHFCKLFRHSNPTMLEMLWSSTFDEIHPLGQELVAGRKKLLSTEAVFGSHRGFAKDQRTKMSLAEPNEHRTAKAIVSYFRIMEQGKDLLSTGDFSPVLPESEFRDFLLDIKYNFDPNKIDAIISRIEEAELKLEEAYNNSVLTNEPDLPWIEELIEKVYLELGKFNEEHSDNQEQRQISRCTS